MKKLSVLALGSVLCLAPAVIAQHHDDHQGGGHQGGGQPGGGYQGGGQPGGGQPGGGGSHQGGPQGFHFNDNDRQGFQSHYRDNSGYRRDMNRWHGDPGRRPDPGFRAGDRYPRGIRFRPVPSYYYRDLQPPPPGYRYGYYDGYVVAYDPTTQIIADVIDIMAGSLR